jgi:hypothetical protein
MNTNPNPNLKITFTLQEIKPLVIENIDNAQNVNSELFIPRLKSYTELHYPLIKFYTKYKKNKPTMADKLCFVILLSYPKNIIDRLNDISDIKLFSHDNTDFNYKDEFTLNHEENENETYDCICSYEKLKLVHIVENIYSGIRLQVGSECITKHKIISNKELKKFNETDKLLKEKRKEIKEGKPIGYYKAEKERQKAEKERQKAEKERQKAEKERQKAEKENEKKLEKIKTGNFKICYTCKINIVDIRKIKLCICNKCKNKNYEELGFQIRHNYGINYCENCERNFIDIKYNTPCLCKDCKTQNKIIKCHMSICSTIMVVDINTNNIFCDDCEKKIIKCIDCKKDFIQNTCEIRCRHCLFNYENKFISKICVSCSEIMNIKSTESWRTYCNDCYREIMDKTKDPPKCNCDIKMSVITVKKDGVNKGRKAFSCSKFPNGCNYFEML